MKKIILYFSTLCSNNEFEYLLRHSRGRLSQQMQKYNLVMARGFAQIKDVEIYALSSRPVSRATHIKKIFKEKKETEYGVRFLYFPIINLRIIKSIIILLSAIKNGIKLSRKNREKNIAMVCDVLNIPLIIASLIVGKITKTPVVGIVTDVPGFFSSDEGENSFKRQIVIKIHQNIIRKCNSYVFLSEYMNAVINLKNKPYLIIEGQVDLEMQNTKVSTNFKQEKKIIMYAGSVDKENGVDILVKAFINANLKDTELHIYGAGPYLKELNKIETEYKSVICFGSVSNSIVVEKEVSASLLINPRPTNVEFVKYSFPSKIMEYMVSGTPLLTTKIPSMPEEYFNYVYLIEDESVVGLTKTLREVIALSQSELYNKGDTAKKFVLSHKNNKVQAIKILEMIEKGQRL